MYSGYCIAVINYNKPEGHSAPSLIGKRTERLTRMYKKPQISTTDPEKEVS
jgi:hypothetical protein